MTVRVRLTAILLCALLLPGVLVGCGGREEPGQQTLEAIEGGAAEFSRGRTERVPVPPPDSGELLDELIRTYSGSWTVPRLVPISPEEMDEIEGRSEQDPGSNASAGGREELLALFRTAYQNSDEMLRFTAAPGFVPDGGMLEDIYISLRREAPEEVFCVSSWSWSVTGNQYSIVIRYDLPREELLRMKEETRQAVEQAAGTLRGEGSDDYTLTRAVNEYLCDTVAYPDAEPYSSQSHSPYGALVEGVAVCDGYSTAAMLLLRELGVECDLVVGESQGGSHAWNLVKVDGQWYQLDVTWNDGCSGTLGGGREEFFLITDEKMRESRVWDESQYPPSAPVPYPGH